MESIYNYLDYKKYLRDFFDYQRSNETFFSFRYVERRVKIDASNIVKIINGKRELSKVGIANFIKYLKLDKNESEYFKNLVFFSKAKKDEECKKYFKKLLTIKDMDITQVRSDRYEFYLKWYYTAVASTLYYFNFYGEDYKELGEQVKPVITEDEARESIELLVRLNFIKKDKDGKFIHTDTTLSTGDKWHSYAIHAFQHETLNLAKKSLEEDSKKVRDFSTVTLTLSEDEFEQIKEITSEYRKAVLKTLDDCKDPDRVYQLNIQFFPLTPPRKSEQ